MLKIKCKCYPPYIPNRLTDLKINLKVSYVIIFWAIRRIFYISFANTTISRYSRFRLKLRSRRGVIFTHMSDPVIQAINTTLPADTRQKERVRELIVEFWRLDRRN